MTTSIALLLHDYREQVETRRLLLGKPLTDDDLVFSQLDGKPVLPSKVTHAWIKLVRRTGLEGVRLHDARHSHASLTLKQGLR